MSDPNSAPSIGKRVGEFLILGLYLVVDIEEIWPKSHFWALIAALVGVLALLLLDGGFSKIGIIYAGLVTTVVCVVIYFVVPPSVIEEIEVHGLQIR